MISEATLTKSHQHDDLSKSCNKSRCAKVDEDNARRPQPYSTNYRQLRDAEMRRNRHPHGRAWHLVIQYQMVSTKNMHISNIM